MLFIIILSVGSIQSDSKKYQKTDLLLDKIEENLKDGNLKEAEVNTAKIIKISKNEDWAVELYSYILMINENRSDFYEEAMKLSKYDLTRAKNNELYKRYTRYDELNKPLNEKINKYVKENYEKLSGEKIAIEEYQEEELRSRLKAEQQEKYINSDNSYRPLVKYLKKYMNDPKSYKHIETIYSIGNDNSLLITTRFRAKNKFGALVVNECEAIANSETGELAVVECN